MPDLREECPPLLPEHFLIATFLGDPDEELVLFRRLMVIWTDNAIAEFDQARGALLAQIEEANRSAEEMARTGRHIYMFDFSKSIEHCILLTRRLLRALDHVKNKGIAQIDRTVRRYIESQSQGLIDVRNFSEHAVETIAGGKFPEKGSLVPRLRPDEKGVEVAEGTISFALLAGLLRQLHLVARELIDAQRMHGR
ncbi:MAG: hypothetical protein KDH20_06095 [Rhodocyclaceae bacterium]|nr:hypothetical protein [Rhodocyclaceae bacterium]